jgi:IS1 family transposase
MRVMCWLLLVVVILGCWISTPVHPLLGEVVIEQQRDFPCEGDAHRGFPISVLCCVVWAEGVEPRRRRRPYRNPLRRLRKWIRRVAKEQRRAAGRAQRMCQHKAEAVRITSPSAEEPSILLTAAEAVDGRRRGRPATIATDHVCCLTKGCRGYGQLGPDPNHWIVGFGTYQTTCGHSRQMYLCEWCKQSFSETRGTVFFGLKTKEETVYRALASLAEGMSIRSTSRVFGVEVETVLLWLKRAGEHCEEVSSYLMQNLKVEQAQLDELWTFVSKKEKTLSAWEKIHTEYGDTWIWTVVDPVNKLVLAFLIGDREEAQAEGVLRRLSATLAEACLPLLTSDHLPHYAQAILKVFGRWVQPERKGLRGRFPKKRLEPSDGSNSNYELLWRI